jgi:hypothetical protein
MWRVDNEVEQMLKVFTDTLNDMIGLDETDRVRRQDYNDPDHWELKVRSDYVDFYGCRVIILQADPFGDSEQNLLIGGFRGKVGDWVFSWMMQFFDSEYTLLYAGEDEELTPQTKEVE